MQAVVSTPHDLHSAGNGAAPLKFAFTGLVQIRHGMLRLDWRFTIFAYGRVHCRGLLFGQHDGKAARRSMIRSTS